MPKFCTNKNKSGAPVRPVRRSFYLQHTVLIVLMRGQEGGEELVHRAEKGKSKPPSRCSTGGFTGGSGSPYSQPLTFCGFPGLGLVVFDPSGSGLREKICLPAYRTICLGLPDVSRGLPSIRSRFILQTTSLPGQFGGGVFSRSASGLDECLEFSAYAGERSGFCFDRLRGLRFFLLFEPWSGN